MAQPVPEVTLIVVAGSASVQKSRHAAHEAEVEIEFRPTCVPEVNPGWAAAGVGEARRELADGQGEGHTRRNLEVALEILKASREMGWPSSGSGSAGTCSLAVNSGNAGVRANPRRLNPARSIMGASAMGTRERRVDRAARRGPFVPGQGKMPPFLAGRETEQAVIRNLLAWLEDKEAPGSDLLLYGPRGNGKTALLEWACREARDRKIGALTFSSKEVQSTQWLARRLSMLPRWLRPLRELSVWRVGIKMSDPEPGRLSDVLARRARRRGLVLAIDEAHTLAIGVGQQVLHAVQRLRGEEVPVMLLLAGTPDLPRHLGKMDASFWARSSRLPLGLLDPDVAGDAVRIPLEAEGRSIADDALAQVVAESHGYPYFLQVWGDLLWDSMPGTPRPASSDDVDRVRPRFEAVRNVYYSDRHAELERARLALVAAKLSAAFVDTGRRTPREVNVTIGAALESEGQASDAAAVMTARDRLHDLGYIWSAGVESRRYFRPGIPSLMQYVARTESIDREL